MEVKKLPREFIFKSGGKTITLKDPDPTMPIDQVRKFYASSYPEMANCSVSSPDVLQTKVKYTFSHSPQTKG